jgi:hypothetical protein
MGFEYIKTNALKESKYLGKVVYDDLPKGLKTIIETKLPEVGVFRFDTSKQNKSHKLNDGTSTTTTITIEIYNGAKKTKEDYFDQYFGRGTALSKIDYVELDSPKKTVMNWASSPKDENKIVKKIIFKRTKAKVGDYSSTVKTKMREDATMYFIQMALDGTELYSKSWPKGHPTWNEIFAYGDNDGKGGPVYKKLAKGPNALIPFIDSDAKNIREEQVSLTASADLMLKVCKTAGWGRQFQYDRDGKHKTMGTGSGFMKFISDIVKNNAGISQKDTWNPADIWLTRKICKEKSFKGQTPQKVIEDAVKLVNSIKDIEILNSVMRRLFISGDVIGVSLKKVAKPQHGAFWKIYNVKMPQFASKTGRFSSSPPSYNYELGKIVCKLNLEGSGSNQELATQETRIFLKDDTKDLYYFTVKTTSGVSKWGSLKYEPTYMPRSAARLGKAPVAHVKKLLGSPYSIASETPTVDKHCNTWNKFPHGNKMMEQYDKKAKDFEKMFDRIVANKVDTGGVKTASEFSSNIRHQIAKNPRFANTKLMQVNFLSALYSSGMTDIKRNQIMNKMLSLAEKLGDGYGPFGKIY